MQQLAAYLLTKMHKGSLILLVGELGTGKTTFTQGLARALGVREAIASPTFTIASEYAAHHPIFTALVHVDLYRLAAAEGMVRELVEQSAQAGRLTVVEWAERLGAVALPPAWRLTFRHGEGPDERIVEIMPPSAA